MSARTATIAAAAALALVSLAGCGSNGGAARSAPDPVPEVTVAATESNTVPSGSTTTTSATHSGLRTSQGWLIKGIGETAGFSGERLDDALVKFTVDRIEVNPKCDQYGQSPKEGNKTVVLYVTMSTGQINQDEASQAALVFNPFYIKGVTADGFVHDAEPGFCLGFEGAFPSQLAPNAKYSGRVDVELPASATTVASVSTLDSSQGWAWQIG
jgi:hypothetical protein